MGAVPGTWDPLRLCPTAGEGTAERSWPVMGRRVQERSARARSSAGPGSDCEPPPVPGVVGSPALGWTRMRQPPPCLRPAQDAPCRSLRNIWVRTSAEAAGWPAWSGAGVWSSGHGARGHATACLHVAVAGSLTQRLS